MKIENWKLKQVEHHLSILHDKSQDFIAEILNDMNLPIPTNFTIDRSQTRIDWEKMDVHYNFYLDDKEEFQIESFLRNSSIIEYKNLILTYGWDEPVIKLPTFVFLEDWEGFVRSQLWEGLIFSEDFNLIIETSRDYYMHSNFKI